MAVMAAINDRAITYKDLSSYKVDYRNNKRWIRD